MAPHSLKIATLVLPSQSPGDKTLLMTDSCNGIAPGVTLKKEASFNIRGSKKCYNVMTYLATEEELEHMARNIVIKMQMQPTLYIIYIMSHLYNWMLDTHFALHVYNFVLFIGLVLIHAVSLHH